MNILAQWAPWIGTLTAVLLFFCGLMVSAFVFFLKRELLRKSGERFALKSKHILHQGRSQDLLINGRKGVERTGVH